MNLFNLREISWDQSLLIIKEFYNNTDIQTPRVNPKDINKVIKEFKSK